MATATVSGLARVNDGDSATGWVNIGGGPGSALTNDVYIQGNGAIGRRVATTTEVRGFGYNGFSATPIDFTTAGNYLWIWINPALGPDLMNTQTNGGLRIRIASTAAGTSNYGEWFVGGGDVTSAGWKRYVLDIGGTSASSTSGTLTKSAVNFIGVTYSYTATPGGNIPHIAVDAIDYGNTITVYGGSTGDRLSWANVSTATEGTSNTWGVLQEKSGVYFCNGNIQLGESSGSNNMYFSDQNAVLIWEDQSFDDGLGGISPSVPATLQGVTVAEDTGTSDFSDGTQIGTGDSATGAGGGIYQTALSSNNALHFTATDADITNVSFFGTTIRRSTSDVSFSSDATNGPNHELYGATFDNDDQVDVGRLVVRNCTFSGYIGTATALIWNANINIKNSAFRGNSDSTNKPAAIEHDTADTYTYDNLTFTGNDYDLENSSTGNVIINASNGANPGVYAYKNTGWTFEASSAQSYNANTTTYTDETTDINNATTNDVLLPPFQTTTVGDAFYFGDSSQFTGITIDLFNLGSHSDITMQWQYWNGAWVEITDVVDETNFFEVAAGIYTINFRDPIDNADWATTSVNGTTLYWIRCVVTAFGASPTISTAPAADQAWLGYTIVDNSVDLEINGIVQNTQCYIVPTAGGSALMNEAAATLVSGNEYSAVESINYSSDTVVTIRAREMGYLPFETSGTVIANGLTVTAVWQVDPNWKLVVSGINITFTNPTTITRASGDFSADGWIAVMSQVTVSGSTNNDGTYTLSAVGTTTVTITGATLTNEGPASGITLTFTRREPTW